MTKSMRTMLVCIGTLSLVGTIVQAQTPPGPAVEVTARTIKSISYQIGTGDTEVDLMPTGLVAGATGSAEVEAKPTLTTVEAKVKGLTPPTQLGVEFLSYVLWAISPEGRAANLGEVRPDADGKAELKTSTQLQSFSLFITAEPYPGVRQPSEMLALENEPRKNTKGTPTIVENYRLLKRSQYQKLGNPLALSLDLKTVPLEMYQARNAVEIAKARGAEKYAPEPLRKAVSELTIAETALSRKEDKKKIISSARQAMQFSEDARAVTAERLEEERIANERAAAAARAKADAEAKAAAEAAATKRQADDAARRQAEQAAAREAQAKADAAANARKASEEASRRAADEARKAAETLRKQLFEQFNRVLKTQDTSRGLVITMADVLFATGKYDLSAGAREALARLAGIVLAHPSLKLEVEGHTDSTGSEQTNQVLSGKRASEVSGYLIKQGLSPNAVTAIGLGPSMPVAENDTAAGRQKNRRVELIVSGEIIGVKIGE